MIIRTVLIVLISLFFVLPKPVFAALSSCSASLTFNSVTPGATDNYTINFQNTDSISSVQWVKITRPSSNFTINSHTITGVSSYDASQITFVGTIAPNGSAAFTFNATAANTTAASADWTVQASDDSGGANAISCSGSLGMSIATPDNPPTISDIVVTDVTDTSVKITWTTDESADSTVDYGATDAYGSSVTGNSNTTSHSTDLTGLSANTTYHYRVKSRDSGGNETVGSDNTFVTAKQGSTGSNQTATNTTTSTTGTSAKASPTPTPKPTPRPDTIAPVVSVDLDFSKPFKETPKFTGKATDGDAGGIGGGVAKIEYSIDDGKNWLPVDNIKDPGAKSTAFDFTPAIFEDGNYQLRVRAKDLSGNLGSLGVKTLVIDRLPPRVGGVIFSIGPQILHPNKDGIILSLAKLDQKITLSAVGGPTEIELLSNLSHLSDLTKNLDSGLWSGSLNFENPGTFELLAKSQDGANNKTEKKLNTVVVLDNGVIKDQKGQVIPNAKLSLYYFEPTIQQFTFWDGKSFGQQNPQKTDSEGKYKLIIPPGKYYLQIEARRFNTLKTNIFKIDQTLPINTSFILNPFKGLQIGPFRFNIFGKTETAIVKSEYPNLPPISNLGILNKELPFFSFKTSNEDLTANSIKGKSTVLTFLSAWSPQTFEQLPILNELSSKKEINTLVVMAQDTASRVNIFRKIGGYNVPMVADPDGILVESLGILNLPTHVFLDRRGIIKKVKVGVLDKEELLNNLIN